jgi:hypothetical protein
MPDEGSTTPANPDGGYGSLQAAIAEAVNSNPDAVGVVTGQTPEGEGQPAPPAEPAPGTEPQPPVAPGESESSKAEPQTPPAPTEGELAEKVSAYTQSDGRVVYWGTDLTDLPAEKQVAIIDHFEQQDSTIHKLQNDLKRPEEPARTEPAPVPDEVEDQDLLRAIGLDPEDPNVESLAPAIVPILRNQLQLEGTVEQMSQRSAAQEAETHWNKTLDELEGAHGKLPGDRLGVLKYAVDNSIASPYEAYFRLQAPVKREVEDFVQAQRRAQGQKDAGGQVRPQASDADTPPIAKGMSLRDAVRAGMEVAEKRSGVKWVDAVRGRITRGAQGPGGPTVQ